MDLKEHLLNRITDALEELGAYENAVEKLEDYLEGNIEENEFLELLPKVDFKTIPHKDTQKTVKAYSSVAKYELKDYIRKYVNILFAIGTASSAEIISRAQYGIQERTIINLINCGVEEYIILTLYVYDITFNKYRLTNRNFNFIYNVCSVHSEEAVKAIELLEVNSKLLLESIYCSCENVQKNNYYDDFLKYIESSFIMSIDSLYDEKLPQELASDVKDFLKGNKPEVDESVISKVKGYNFNDYIFKLLAGLSALNIDKSDILKRVVQFLVKIDFIRALNSVYDIVPVSISGYSNTVDNLDKILSIPCKYYIAWYAGKFKENENAKYALKYMLKKDKKSFEEAIELSSGSNKNYLMTFMLDTDEKSKYVKGIEENCVSIFRKLLLKDNISEDKINEMEEFLRGKVSFEEVKEALYSMDLIREHSWDIQNELVGVINILPKDVEQSFSMYENSIVLLGGFVYFKEIEKLAEIRKKNSGVDYSSEKFEAIFSIFSKHNVDTNKQMYVIDNIINDYDYNGRKAEVLKSVLGNLVFEHKNEVAENLKSLSADGRCLFLDYMFEFKNEENAKILVNNFGDGSKKVKEKLAELFANEPEYMEFITDKLKAKKQGEREISINILSKWCAGDSLQNEKKEAVKSLLTGALEVEKNQKIRTLIMNVLGLEEKGKVKELKGKELVKNILKGNKKTSLSWLDFEDLKKVRLKGKEDFCEEDYLKALLICYSSLNGVGISKDGKTIAEKLDEADLSLFANEVFDIWFTKGAEAKKKWVLSFASIYGKDQIISKLQKCINDWAKNSRGAIAGEAVKALAINGSSQALLIVDGISRKFKFKQVKKAAGAALSFAANEMGMDREELSDKIVPSLGFDARGERIFDYGNRKFKVSLAPDLTIEIYDENEKELKKLPSPGKRDDEAKAKQAYEEYKMFKKQLKTTVTVQTTRMDLALSTERKWTQSAWLNLFVENPIMHKFAIGLIWGIYEDLKLIDTFRYMEDGTFSTKDEDEFQFPENSSIGLVHPLELSKEDMELWKKQLSDYEIDQPIKQLDREVFKITEKEKEMKYLDRFGGKIVNGLSLAGKIMSYGWYRGSVQDAGGYYEFYTEDKKLGIGVELNFQGLFVGDENEDTTVYVLRFYRSDTVKRGSYVYDEIKEKDLLKISEVPSRYFSEILYQVNNSLSSSTGVDENWKRDVTIKLS